MDENLERKKMQQTKLRASIKWRLFLLNSSKMVLASFLLSTMSAILQILRINIASIALCFISVSIQLVLLLEIFRKNKYESLEITGSRSRAEKPSHSFLIPNESKSNLKSKSYRKSISVDEKSESSRNSSKVFPVKKSGLVLRECSEQEADPLPSIETPWSRAVKILSLLIEKLGDKLNVQSLKEVLHILSDPETMLTGTPSETFMDSETALWFKNTLSNSNGKGPDPTEKFSSKWTFVKAKLPAIRRVLERDGQLLTPTVVFQDKTLSSMVLKSFRADKDHMRRQLAAAKRIQEGNRDVNLANLNLFDPEICSGCSEHTSALIIPPFPGTSLEKMHDIEVYLQKHSFAEWEFDIFEFNEVCGNHALWFIPMVLIHFYNLVGLFTIDPKKLSALLIHAENTYCFDPLKPNIYHNSLHAADVALTAFHYCNNEHVGKELNGLHGFSFILAAVFHDYRHPGLNNVYLVKSQNDIAVMYNDLSVLENFHASQAYRLFNQDAFKIFGALTSQEQAAFRSYFIKSILATDLANGFEYVSKFKNIAETTKDFSDFSSKILLMQMALKCADVAHPSKPWHLHEKWSLLIVDEFFAQGDLEKEQKLPVSPLCDRQNSNLPKSQCDFIDFVVRPCLEPFSKFCQEKKWVTIVQDNYIEWKTQQRVSVRHLDHAWSRKASVRKCV